MHLKYATAIAFLMALGLVGVIAAQLSVAQGTDSPQPQPAAMQAHAPGAPAVRSQPRTRKPGHAGDWLRKYKDLPPDQQEKALENDPEFKKLPPDRQAKLRQRLHRFTDLPPQKQRVILDRMEIWEHLTPAQKQHAKGLFAKIRQMPPDRRTAMLGAIRDLRQMGPDQRHEAIDSEKYRGGFSDAEREVLKGVITLPLAPLPTATADQVSTGQASPQQ